MLVERREQERQRRLRHARRSGQRLRVRREALIGEQLLDERVEHGSCRRTQVHDERRNRRFRARQS